MRVPHRLLTPGLVAFAVLDIVLVGVALRSTAAPPPASELGQVSSTSAPSAAGTPSRAPSPARSPSPTASSTSSTTKTRSPKAPAPAPLTVLIVGVSPTVAWRAETGSCATGGSSLAVTTDGGSTWAAGTAPFPGIVRVKPSSSRSAFAVGGDSACQPGYAATSSQGGAWSTGGPLGRAWYRDPARPSAVHAPGPLTVTPCGRHAVLDLAVVSSSGARALCAGGLVVSSSDTGASWSDAGRVAGAVALAVLPSSPSQTYVAAVGVASCAGVSLQQLGTKAPLSCARVSGLGGPGQVALSVVDGGGWLAVGHRTLRSTDSLATWSVR